MASSGQDPGDNRPPEDNRRYGDNAAPKSLEGILKFAIENTPPTLAIEAGDGSGSTESDRTAGSVAEVSTESFISLWIEN